MMVKMTHREQLGMSVTTFCEIQLMLRFLTRRYTVLPENMVLGKTQNMQMELDSFLVSLYFLYFKTIP